MLSLDGIPLLGALDWPLTLHRMSRTPQSLTLVIWGACRTLGGPGFEPLISKVSE